MARAHASGIKLRDNTAPEPTLNQPRVVVSVETDPRKVPTHKRLLEGREPAADGSRAAMLPGGAIHTTPPSGGKAPPSTRAPAAPASPPAAAPTAAPAIEPAGKLAAWARVGLVLVFLLLVVGIAQRFRPSAAYERASAARSAASISLPPSAAPAPVASAPPLPVFPPREPPAASSVGPVATSAAPAPRPPQMKPAAASRATFTPPFQLPGEKN